VVLFLKNPIETLELHGQWKYQRTERLIKRVDLVINSETQELWIDGKKKKDFL